MYKKSWLTYLCNVVCWIGSYENEVLENEARSMKHPKLENEAPKSQNHCRLKNYNFKSCMSQAKPGGGNGCVKALKWPRIGRKREGLNISNWLCLKLIMFHWQDWQALTVTAVIPYIV